jgi:hypothetical protein
MLELVALKAVFVLTLGAVDGWLVRGVLRSVPRSGDWWIGVLLSVSVGLLVLAELLRLVAMVAGGTVGQPGGPVVGGGI